ncbi:hypothetical protein Tco_1184483 [Tanacetum coccineum]
MRISSHQESHFPMILQLLLCALRIIQLIFLIRNTPDLNEFETSYGLLKGQYTVIDLFKNTPYCLVEQIRRLDCRSQYAVLSGKVDTSYPTGGYGVSVDLSEQDT